MSCHCSNCAQNYNPLAYPQPNYNQQNQYDGDYIYLICKKKRCDKCKRRKCRCGSNDDYSSENKGKRCKEDSKCYSEEDSDDCHSEKKRKHHKCKEEDCHSEKKRECPKTVPYLQTRCGCISASLAKSADPVTVTAAGQLITYTYTITNTGNLPICYPIQICDNKLGGQFIPGSFILPGQSQAFVRTYITIDTDLLSPTIINTATAYIQVKCDKWVCTQPATAVVNVVLPV